MTSPWPPVTWEQDRVTVGGGGQDRIDVKIESEIVYLPYAYCIRSRFEGNTWSRPILFYSPHGRIEGAGMKRKENREWNDGMYSP